MCRKIAAQKIQEINSALINFIGCGYFITFHEYRGIFEL